MDNGKEWRLDRRTVYGGEERRKIKRREHAVGFHFALSL
jgi:hypothetical protein